jgi:hypothetical protein
MRYIWHEIVETHHSNWRNVQLLCFAGIALCLIDLGFVIYSAITR